MPNGNPQIRMGAPLGAGPGFRPTGPGGPMRPRMMGPGFRPPLGGPRPPMYQQSVQ